MVQTADGWFYSAASHFKESVIHPTKELCQWRSSAQSSDQESVFIRLIYVTRETFKRFSNLWRKKAPHEQDGSMLSCAVLPLRTNHIFPTSPHLSAFLWIVTSVSWLRLTGFRPSVLLLWVISGSGCCAFSDALQCEFKHGGKDLRNKEWPDETVLWCILSVTTWTSYCSIL